MPPSGDGCYECLQTGDEWVELRLCQTCGHVGCCDNSKNTHATRHFQTTSHPLIRSFEPGEGWFWCDVDDLLFDVEGMAPGPSLTPERGPRSHDGRRSGRMGGCDAGGRPRALGGTS